MKTQDDNRVVQETAERLEKLDCLFYGFFEWLEGQYDSSTGGFFYAVSSKRSGQFRPDIESTAQALNILERCGLLAGLGEGMKAGLVRFFQSKQDPASGYFYDEDPAMREDDVMVGRAFGYSVHALRKLGAEPVYPLPAERNAAPSYMRSVPAYREWLHSIDLRNSWRGCDRLCNSAPYIEQLTGAERDMYVQAALDYFADIQHPATGLWGEGAPYVRVSGTFKLLTFYSRFGIPMPRVHEMYRSLLNCLRHDEAVDMCYIRNPVNLLSSMKLPIPAEDMLEIATITVRNVSRLKRSDGGFSRELGHSPVAPNVAQVKPGEAYPDMPKPVHLGLGLVEGDMNAGTQAVLIRWQLYELAGLPMPKLRMPERGIGFNER
ncbi:hypothetical protein [Cohnella sp.]|uniref:hypothetical protein n=1 Tax=Cohnella sp. TaxID=1883426 RepID=UPI003569F7BE